VIVGFQWDEYPCYKGYSSTDGKHGEGCTECTDGSYQGAFSSADFPTTCQTCDRSAKENLYTATLDDKQNDTCQSCAVPRVIKDGALGTCVLCDAGEEFYASGGDCAYPTIIDRTVETVITFDDVTLCTDLVTCRACEEGTYNTAESANFCKYCADGNIPTTANDSCEACPTGTYWDGGVSRVECQECADGSYTDTTAATVCVVCASGSISNDGKTACEPCPSGTFMEADRSECTPCADTEYSNASATECVECELGTVPNDANNACDPCSAGEFMNSDKINCDVCATGLYSEASATECVICAEGEITTDHITCSPCPDGEDPVSTNDACVTCGPGEYKDSDMTLCDNCTSGSISVAGASECTACSPGTYEDLETNSCEECPAGTFQGAEGEATCETCPDNTYSTGSATYCDYCEQGQQVTDDDGTEGGEGCEDCLAGFYQELTEGGTCTACPVGTMSTSVKTATCTPCEPGTYQSSTGETTCVPCAAGTSQREEGSGTCVDCEAGQYTDVEGLAQCKACPMGMVQPSVGETACTECQQGYHQSLTGQDSCDTCEDNTFNAQTGQKECEVCADNMYSFSDTSPTICLQCPEADDLEDMEAGIQKEKCESDLGDGCYSQTINDKYGDYQTTWMEINTSQSYPCFWDVDHDAEATQQAHFHCKLINERMDIEKVYDCIRTNKSNALDDLAANDNATADEKADIMESLTNDTATNGIGDVAAVSNVLDSITSADEDGETATISTNLTTSILNTVSNLVVSNFDLSENNTATAANISNTLVQQIVEVAAAVEEKNVPITSSNVAIVSIQQDVDDDQVAAPNTDGIVSFSLPASSTGLNNLTVGSDSSDSSNTLLLIETLEGETGTTMDMSVVLITDSTLMPDLEISTTPISLSNSDAEVSTSILEDLSNAISDSSDDSTTKAYVNSMITEVTVNTSGVDLDAFKLNLYMKPTTDIGDSGTSLETESDGRRLQIVYMCAKYNSDLAKWEESCQTVYDTENPSLGVLCLCTHNTSFAVLMSASEIDRGYAASQTILTHVLLSLSTVGLLLTLIFLLPAKALRATRSSKINICFTTALLVASVSFILQDILIKSDNTGIIKLKSTGCIAYAMIQHYLWLVVFCWMVVEGFLMYLSLVQVFGSHISKYMLKFNIAAWGIPLPFPFIGYFAFTKTYTVGDFTFTEHGYLSDTACFIRSESIAFYTLFLLPLLLVIVVNLVFFVMVVRVIKNSKSSGTITDQEQLLRQLKAATGVMVLLGTGWFFGIFMSVPAPDFQVFMQYFFIIINSAQGCFVFLFYIVLNDQVKTHWLVRVGLQQKKAAGTSSAAGGKSTLSGAATKQTSVSVPNQDNIYENASAAAEDHTYATAEYANADKDGKCEFPAKSDDNTNI